MEEHGERVAAGDWQVTDAERAAAGRETVTGRFLALLPANRERAARRYADGGLPDGEEMVRVWLPRDPAELATRLGGKQLTAWAEDDVPHRVARGSRQVRHYLAAGTLERGFRHGTSEWAGRLDRSGTPYTHREWAGGHDNWWWRVQLPTALAWLLAGQDAGQAAGLPELTGCAVTYDCALCPASTAWTA
jgi:hypothetical protein